MESMMGVPTTSVEREADTTAPPMRPRQNPLEAFWRLYYKPILLTATGMVFIVIASITSFLYLNNYVNKQPAIGPVCMVLGLLSCLIGLMWMIKIKNSLEDQEPPRDQVVYRQGTISILKWEGSSPTEAGRSDPPSSESRNLL